MLLPRMWTVRMKSGSVFGSVFLDIVKIIADEG